MMRLITVVCLSFAFVGCGKAINDTLPSVADITAIDASLYNRPDSGPSIPKFSILPQDYDKIISLLADAQVDRRPSKWQVLGSIVISRSSGSDCEIDLYWTSRGLGAFSISGTYYRGSTDEHLIGVLTACHARTQHEDGVVEQPSGDDRQKSVSNE